MRATLEVADIFRHHGPAFRIDQAGHISRDQSRVMGAIEACRSARLGGHVEQCRDCGKGHIAYNSCIMGKIRNGESAILCIGFDAALRPYHSPLRSPPEHRYQFVRWPEGTFPEVWRNDGLHSFKFLGGITAGIDFGGRKIAMTKP